MSKFAILGTLANVVATVGIAAPMGVEINKEKHNGGWNNVVVNNLSSIQKGTGTGNLTKKEHIATQEMYNWICYKHIYEKEINLKKFCLTTHDLPPTGIT